MQIVTNWLPSLSLSLSSIYLALSLLQFFLKSSNVKYFKRKQFARLIWNIAFYSACCLFLHFYNEFMILPHLMKNQGRYSLFHSSDNLIFYRSHQYEKFQFYSIFIITFYLHGAMLDFKDADFLEAASKGLYLLSLVAIDVYRYSTSTFNHKQCIALYLNCLDMKTILSAWISHWACTAFWPNRCHC